MVSKAFEKSNERTMTYGSVVSKLMTVFIREMMAAVGDQQYFSLIILPNIGRFYFFSLLDSAGNLQ